MSTAREEILASVRAALAGADTTPVPVPDGHRHRPVPADAADAADAVNVVGLFAERVADYRAIVERCTADQVRDRIAAALGTAARILVPDGLPWPVPGATADAGFTATELDGFDAVVTGATLGIAETGTLVLTHGPGQGRRALTLIPDQHVCLIHATDVVPDVPTAIALLDPARPQTWISGPSATSDIELDRVEGVHGPRTLHVIVVG